MIASRTGRRRKPDGNRVSPGTLDTYTNCRRLLGLFSAAYGTPWEIHTGLRVSKLEFRRSRQYWERFARKFSDFLYGRGYFDNYVSNLFKVMRTFLHYVEEQYGWQVRHLLPHLLARAEQIPVIALSAEQFRQLLMDDPFLSRLKPNQRFIRDLFVVGCTTALRVSDLFQIRQKHLYRQGGQTWLVMKSAKTGTETRLLLPEYVLEIFSRYRLRNGRLLPAISNVNLNKQIKKLGELVGWTEPVIRYRNRRGVPVPITGKISKRPFRFCDLLTSHTMRRTGVSMLLELGMPEQLVRQISGHKPGSREFYRYVSRNQSWQDEQSGLAFGKLCKDGYLS